MNLHEYQAKDILQQYGVQVPQGVLVCSQEEASLVKKSSLSSHVVVKAQVHAGGRGKAGGVKLCRFDQRQETVNDMLGSYLMTAQTGQEGKLVRKVWIEEAVNIAHEYYLALLLDRSLHCISFMLSRQGGTDIEEVAQHAPQDILHVPIHPSSGLQAWHIRRMAFFLQLDKQHQRTFHTLAHQLYQAFVENDAGMLELNPLGRTQ